MGSTLWEGNNYTFINLKLVLLILKHVLITTCFYLIIKRVLSNINILFLLINLLNLNCFKHLEEQMFKVLLIIKHVLILQILGLIF